MDTPDLHDDYDDGSVLCPNCMGSGEVNCYCAGDFCICDNQGDAPCPVCHGEREVTEERSDQYFANQRRAHEALHKIMADFHPTTPPKGETE